MMLVPDSGEKTVTALLREMAEKAAEAGGTDRLMPWWDVAVGFALREQEAAGVPAMVEALAFYGDGQNYRGLSSTATPPPAVILDIGKRARAVLGGEVQGGSDRSELEAVEKLMFRPDGPRPVWRNKHTGKEAVVLDLTVDDNGGFQGGCRRFVVVIDEDGLPWKPTPDSGEARPAYPGKRRFSVTRFLEHWEPTGPDVAAVDGETTTTKGSK